MIPEQLTNEISELEARLAAKKQEAAQQGIEAPEKETFKEAFQEHVVATGAPAPAPVSNPQSTAPTAMPSRELTEEEKVKLQSFVEHSFTKGIAAAISEAQKMGDPFFIDSLHDELADQYYEKLIQARKLKQL